MKSQFVTTRDLPEMPALKPRSSTALGKGATLESDQDYADKNLDAVAWFLENHEMIRKALAQKVLPVLETPIFQQNGRFVRGPSRPSGSGAKQMVFPMQSERDAELTATNLNELFAAHTANK